MNLFDTFTQVDVFWAADSFIALLVCAGCTMFLIPQVLLISYRKKLFDSNDERKIHHSNVPRLGGFTFKPIILFSMSLSLGFIHILGYDNMLKQLSPDIFPFAFCLCAVLILYVAGLADDLIGIRYMSKFIVQILSAGLVIAGGLYIGDFNGFLFIDNMTPMVGYLLTIIITVFIINSINLIDGIDGLASGLSGVACLIYGITLFSYKQYAYAFLSFATLGVLIPFFCYNVFGNAEKHTKIFMGDTGSMTIGMILCILCIKLNNVVPHEGTTIQNPMIIAFAPLIVPCFDVIRVFVHRVKNRKNPFLPDNNHIHHKLLGIGIKQNRAMVYIVLASMVFTISNIMLSKYFDPTLLIAIDVIIMIAINVFLTKKLKLLSDAKKRIDYQQ